MGACDTSLPPSSVLSFYFVHASSFFRRRTSSVYMLQLLEASGAGNKNNHSELIPINSVPRQTIITPSCSLSFCLALSDFVIPYSFLEADINLPPLRLCMCGVQSPRAK